MRPLQVMVGRAVVLRVRAAATSLSARRGTAVRRSISAGVLCCESAQSWITCPRRPDRPRVFDFARGRIGCSEAPQRGDQSDLCGYTFVDYRRPSRRATMSFVARGCSAVGSASPCQGEGRGFESRRPLEEVQAVTWVASAVGWPRGEATACKAVYTGSNPVPTSSERCMRARAISSAGERFPDTEEVTGSIPVSPTT